MVTVQRCHGHCCQASLIRRRSSLALLSLAVTEERSLETRRWRPSLKYDSHSHAPSLTPRSLIRSLVHSFPRSFPSPQPTAAAISSGPFAQLQLLPHSRAGFNEKTTRHVFSVNSLCLLFVICLFVFFPSVFFPFSSF